MENENVVILENIDSLKVNTWHAVISKDLESSSPGPPRE
jgi:hypothetical protein